MSDALNMALGDVIKSNKEERRKNKKDFKKSPKKVEKTESTRQVKKVGGAIKVNVPVKTNNNNNKKVSDILSRFARSSKEQIGLSERYTIRFFIIIEFAILMPLVIF